MDKFPVVAVAFSAGDLEPVSELLSALPSACGAALIIVQRLDATREELLCAALAQRTSRLVKRAEDGAAPQRSCVYVCPPNATLTMMGGRFHVTPKAGSPNPGDVLFSSLAEDSDGEAIGVVLSGEGSDGASGLQAIHRHGGTTLAQYPGSARFPSMPINAIDTGCVDFVLRPNEIARKLADLGGYPVGPADRGLRGVRDAAAAVLTGA